jgi:hypothetical protein
MYASLFLLFLVMVLWAMTYKEGLDDGITPSVTTDSTLPPSADSTSTLPPSADSTSTLPPAPMTSTPPTGSVSACESVNAQNQVDLQNLTTKVNTALQLSETVKKLEATLQDNTTRIDTIINTQLTALVSGKR